METKIKVEGLVYFRNGVYEFTGEYRVPTIEDFYLSGHCVFRGPGNAKQWILKKI